MFLALYAYLFQKIVIWVFSADQNECKQNERSNHENKILIFSIYFPRKQKKSARRTLKISLQLIV